MPVISSGYASTNFQGGKEDKPGADGGGLVPAAAVGGQQMTRKKNDLKDTVDRLEFQVPELTTATTTTKENTANTPRGTTTTQRPTIRGELAI